MEIGSFGVRPTGLPPRPVADSTVKSVPSREETRRAESVSMSVPDQPVEIGSGQSAFFAVDGNGKVVIRVVDQTGKMVAQIPDAELLRVMQIMTGRSEAVAVDRKA